MTLAMKNGLGVAFCFLAIAVQAQTVRESGIYVRSGNSLEQITSTTVPKAKPSGLLKNAATMGIKGVDIKIAVDGARSERRIATNMPSFVFYGDDYKPAEYQLIMLESKDDRREAKTGKVGLFGRTKFAVDKKKVIKIKASKAEDGGWTVSTEKSLEKGEFAFLLKTAAPERIWSFGID